MYSLNLIPNFGLFYDMISRLDEIIIVVSSIAWIYGLFVLTFGIIKKVKNKNNV